MALKSTSTTRIPLPPPSGILATTPPEILPVPVIFQEETNWCWAACCEMLFQYFNFLDDSQCEIATVVFSPEDCCSDAGPCNQGQLVSEVFEDFFYFPFQPKNGPLTAVEIHQEISADRPVEVLWRWNGQSTGHVVLIIGEYATGDVEVIDPRHSYGQDRFSYEEVLDAGGAGAWSYSYYELNEV